MLTFRTKIFFFKIFSAYNWLALITQGPRIPRADYNVKVSVYALTSAQFNSVPSVVVQPSSRTLYICFFFFFAVWDLNSGPTP
jgi:hypothetical protein